MVDEAYFFDSYALIEIIKGNADYQNYRRCEAVLTKLNLFEVYFKLLKEFSEAQADKFLDDSYDLAVDFNKSVIRLAAKFKLENPRKNLSMADCIGYILSRIMGIKFLTGDESFEGMENAEYVK